jgi:release factor glutamine methyltransferase
VTIGAVLAEATAALQAAGIPTARPDAEYLAARVLGTTRLALHVEPRRPLDGTARTTLHGLVARRARQEPLQYLLGEAEFAGLTLQVGPGVFVPRPETEALVERARAALHADRGVGTARDGSPPPTVIDLCTGSAAVACALAAGGGGLTVWAVERESAAAAWARANVARLGVEAWVTVVEGDLFTPLRGRGLAGRCDLVAANPPYLAESILATLPAEVREWEPRAALDGGPDGTRVVAQILAEAPRWLRSGGTLLVEIGEDHGAWARARLAADPRYQGGTVHRDFRGCERLLEARRV